MTTETTALPKGWPTDIEPVRGKCWMGEVEIVHNPALPEEPHASIVMLIGTGTKWVSQLSDEGRAVVAAIGAENAAAEKKAEAERLAMERAFLDNEAKAANAPPAEPPPT